MSTDSVPVCPSCERKKRDKIHHWPMCVGCANPIENYYLFYDDSCVAVKGCDNCLNPKERLVRYGTGGPLFTPESLRGSYQEARMYEYKAHVAQVHAAMVEGLSKIDLGFIE